MRERLDNPLTELLALLALVHRNVLNMSDAAKPAQKLALDKDGADADDAVGGLVDDDETVVGVGDGAHGVELVDPGGFAKVVDDGENGENGEVAAVVVCRREGADLWGRLDVVDAARCAHTINPEGNNPETSGEINSSGKRKSRGG